MVGNQRITGNVGAMACPMVHIEDTLTTMSPSGHIPRNSNHFTAIIAAAMMLSFTGISHGGMVSSVCTMSGELLSSILTPYGAMECTYSSANSEYAPKRDPKSLRAAPLLRFMVSPFTDAPELPSGPSRGSLPPPAC